MPPSAVVIALFQKARFRAAHNLLILLDWNWPFGVSQKVQIIGHDEVSDDQWHNGARRRTAQEVEKAAVWKNTTSTEHSREQSGNRGIVRSNPKVLISAVSLVMALVAISPIPQNRKEPKSNGITILGTRYSSRVKTLRDQVAATHQKPVSFQPISGHIDDTIQINEDEIVVSVHPGSSQDVVAHELMHAVLHSEGYANFFDLQVPQLPLSGKLRVVLDSILDHLIINARLVQLGYDPQRGFLAKGLLRNKVYK